LDAPSQDKARAFDISKLNKAGSRVGPRGRPGKALASAAAAAKDAGSKKEAAPKKKVRSRVLLAAAQAEPVG